MLSRLQLTKIHAILAAVILPVALMFFVTGALYTWGVKGDYVTTTHELPLAAPLANDKQALLALASAALAEREISPPSGSASVRAVGGSFQLEWTGAGRDVTLEPTANAQLALLKVKDTTWYRHMVQLHKAKGGVAFKVYAAFMATALMLLLLTGYFIALQTPLLRKLTLGTTAAGAVAFAAFFLVS
jgi:hypothetical protein